MIDERNPYMLQVGDIITAYNSGIHELQSIVEKPDKTLEVTYNQVYSIDGRPSAINRPATCNMSCCKPALLEIPKIKQRIKMLNELLAYLYTTDNFLKKKAG